MFNNKQTHLFGQQALCNQKTIPAASLTLTIDHIENTNLIFFFSGGTKRSPPWDSQVNNDDPPNTAHTVFFQYLEIPSRHFFLLLQNKEH